MMAPVVRAGEDGERELLMMRWGMPCPPQYGSRPVTNIRNCGSPHWRPWLGPRHRCLVPATSFCEWTDASPKVTHWFALDESRPLHVFGCGGGWCELAYGARHGWASQRYLATGGFRQAQPAVVSRRLPTYGYERWRDEGFEPWWHLDLD